ncbi:Peroxisomal membrane protein PEX14 [Zea mays]|nr:Peroxisomal membrane protein PEX14 [Zea mays]AQK79670.1 Peroxisomal membrane protein PEX14 [Zea mays]
MHPATAGPVVRPRFSWYQAFLAAGLLLGFGASTAVFIKKLFLPRLKSWIRNVVAQGDGAEGNQLKHRIDEETAEAVKASASAVSAIAKTNQQLLASKDEEKKILVTLTQALDSQAKELKSLTESINRTREPINITRDDRFSQHRPLEDHVPPVTRNGQCIKFMVSCFMFWCLALLSKAAHLVLRKGYNFFTQHLRESHNIAICLVVISGAINSSWRSSQVCTYNIHPYSCSTSTLTH